MDHGGGTRGSGDKRVIIAYDGSEPAGNAIDHAARLFSGMPAVVVTVWRSFREAARAARAALPQSMIDEAVRNFDAAQEAAALELAQEGAARARAAGLEADAVAMRADLSVWATIVRLADDSAAPAVVVGSRGQSSLRSAVLGSVSNAVVHHCRPPVVVVHPADVAS